MSFSHPLRLETPYDNRNYVALCSEVFSNEIFEVNSSKATTNMNGQDMFIIISPNFLSIQFRATFFMRYPDDSLNRIRVLINLFNFKHREINKLAVPVIVARIDIARDYLKVIPEELSKYLHNNKIYFKKFSPPVYRPISRLDYPSETENFCSSKWHLRIYRKDKQALTFKDDFRKNWIKEMGYENQIVTRFELEMRCSKRLKDVTFNFYNIKVQIQSLIQLSLRDFYLTHKILNRSGNEEKNWRNLFIINKNITLKRPRTFSNKFLDFGFRQIESPQSLMSRYLNLKLNSHTDLEIGTFQNSLHADFLTALKDLDEKKRLKKLKLEITQDYFKHILSFGEILLNNDEDEDKAA